MVIIKGNIKIIGDILKTESLLVMQKHSCPVQCIYNTWRVFQPLIFSLLVDKSHIKLGIMCYNCSILTEFQKFRQYSFNFVSIPYHIICNICKPCNFFRNIHFRIYKHRKFIYYFFPF